MIDSVCGAGMTERMKTAAIGAGAVILSTVITVVGMVQYQRWVEGPKEGIFSVDLSCISNQDIPIELREQIKQYPCNLEIAHVDGPSVERLSVTIDSRNTLTDLRLIRDDEDTNPKFDDNGFSLTLDVRELRKGSVVEYEFKSTGPPDLDKRVVVSKGRAVDSLRAEPQKEWYTQIVTAGVRSQHLTYEDACDISKGEKCYEKDLSLWQDLFGYNTLAPFIMSQLVVTKENLSLGAIGIEKDFFLI